MTTIDLMQSVDPMHRCRARAQGAGGRPCRNRPMVGQNVCRMHGGQAPQALAKAEDRIRALVHPSLDRIQKAIADDDNPQLALAAARDILDRAGFKATEKVQSDGRVVIEVEYVDRPLRLSDTP